MAFSDHKITAFTHKITDLPDQPNLPADELKARFDSSPEELRVAHNALCDDADRLDDRVSGIIAETFGDTISKSMLSDELQDEIDAKAEAADLTAETTARAGETASLGSRMSAAESTITTHTSQIAQKSELYFGTYTGNGAESRLISIGFTPRMVLVLRTGVAVFYMNGNNETVAGGMALTGHPANYYGDECIKIESNGFRIYQGYTEYVTQELNTTSQTYFYLAMK